MANILRGLSLFDFLEEEETVINETDSKCISMENKNFDDVFQYYDSLNEDISHMGSRDDICTPMSCVKKMVDYVPSELWNRKKISVLDPCCGNGNFGAYIRTKTDDDNIFYSDLNMTRVKNCKKILNPQNVVCADAFSLSGKFNRKYDLVVANPPYSGGGNKNRSLSNLFIELAIDLLEDKGYLCFITPNNWMTYNNSNTTLEKLLKLGSFLVIDNDAKRYFPSVGSSFVIFVWQKKIFNNKTKIVNSFLKRDEQENVEIPSDLKFLPLYISQDVLNIISKVITENETGFKYRCDLHNFTQNSYLSDVKNSQFPYETIHTPKKTRYASKKQDIYDKWIIIIPLSTYFLPYLKHHVNTTQSVGYYEFETKEEATKFLEKLKASYIKVMVHITRYGNFNNIMVLKHLKFSENINFTKSEIKTIKELSTLIKY